MGLDRNARRALDLYREAQRLKAAGQLPAKARADIAPIRVRLERDVDRTRADPNCKRCHGTGLLGTKVIPGNRGCEPVRVPIICRCVARNGGVKPDGFDQLRAQAQVAPASCEQSGISAVRVPEKDTSD